MEIRHGTCTACKASFRIPSSFQADKAKCSKCGGVVQIGPPTADAASARGAAAPQVPARAQPRASASRAPAASRGRAPEREEEPRQGRKRAKGGLPIGAKITLAIVCPLLAVAAYVTWEWSLAAEEDVKRQELARADQEAMDKQRADAAKREKEAEAAKLLEEAKSIAAAAKAGDPKDPAAAVKPTKPPPPPPKPVEGFDLTTIPDFEAPEGTPPDRWKEIQKLAATFADYTAGAAAISAGDQLLDAPKQTFPAMLNQLKKQDLESEQGFAIANSIVKTLEGICPRHTIRWKSKLEKEWLKHDQRAIKSWCDLWTKSTTDAPYWEKVTKKREPPPDPDAPKPEGGK